MRNNPLKYTDPSGYEYGDEDAGGGIGSAGYGGYGSLGSSESDGLGDNDSGFGGNDSDGGGDDYDSINAKNYDPGKANDNQAIENDFNSSPHSGVGERDSFKDWEDWEKSNNHFGELKNNNIPDDLEPQKPSTLIDFFKTITNIIDKINPEKHKLNPKSSGGIRGSLDIDDEKDDTISSFEISSLRMDNVP